MMAVILRVLLMLLIEVVELCHGRCRSLSWLRNNQAQYSALQVAWHIHDWSHVPMRLLLDTMS